MVVFLYIVFPALTVSLWVYNLLLQIWLFNVNLSDNNVIKKLVTWSCYVSFTSTYWIILDSMDTLDCMILGVYMYILWPYFTICN